MESTTSDKPSIVVPPLSLEEEQRQQLQQQQQQQLEQQVQVQLQKEIREVVLVAGGTGVLGVGIVKTLLSRNFVVAVPAPHEEQLAELVSEIARANKQGLPATPVAERSAYRESGATTTPTTQPTTLTMEDSTHLLPPVENFSKVAHKRGHLFTIIGDIGDPKDAAMIRETIFARFGRLDRVIDALNRCWSKGVTTDLSYEEWDEAMHGMVGAHFVCVKEFLPGLRENGRGSYTFVTGRGGEACFTPEMGMMTIGTAALFGLVEAIKSEAKSYKGVIVNEVRLGLRVVKEGEDEERDKQIYGEHISASPLYVGKAVVAIALSATLSCDNPPFFFYSLQEVDEVLHKLWQSAKKKQQPFHTYVNN